MDYNQYKEKVENTYSIRFDFENIKSQKTRDIIFQTLSDEYDSLCKNLGIENASFGETSPISLPKDIVVSI